MGPQCGIGSCSIKFLSLKGYFCGTILSHGTKSHCVNPPLVLYHSKLIKIGIYSLVQSFIHVYRIFTFMHFTNVCRHNKFYVCISDNIYILLVTIDFQLLYYVIYYQEFKKKQHHLDGFQFCIFVNVNYLKIPLKSDSISNSGNFNRMK